MRHLAKPFGALIVLAALAACTNAPPAAPARLGVDAAWVRLPAVPGRPGAAYFTLHGGTAPARLIAVESTAVATVELHESMAAGSGAMPGMMTMKPLAAVDLPPAATLAFAPQGRHAMLFGIAPAVKPGDRLPLALRFADGTRLVASARVVAAGDPAPAAP